MLVKTSLLLTEYTQYNIVKKGEYPNINHSYREEDQVVHTEDGMILT